MADTENKAEVMPDEPHGDGSMSVKELAEFAGVTAAAIRKAWKTGRLRRCNAAREQPRFSREECERFVQARELRGTAGAIVRGEGREDLEVTAADAITNLVSQAQGHTENAWQQMVAIMGDYRRGVSELAASKDKEIGLLHKRIEKLESMRDELSDALDELRKGQFNKTIADAEAEAVKQRTKGLLDVAKFMAPAVIARFFGGEQLQSGAFQKLIESMTDEQRSSLFMAVGNVLTPDQLAALTTLLSQWEAKQGAASAKENPPPAEASEGSSAKESTG